MSESEKYTTLRDFWPFYLREHAEPVNRALHYAGSTLVLIVLACAILFQNPWLALLMPITGYGFAWFGHFFVEKNRPATFTYPVYSLISDWIMYGYWLVGRLNGELEKAGVPARQRATAGF